MRILANAKINWALDILSRRPDGYHEMDMLMQPISLSDEISLFPAPDISLTVSGTPRIPADAHHLALRAARLLQELSGTQCGAALHVHKRIPSGAGLGGGSADAAGVLLGLNRLWNLNFPAPRLEEIGLQLGADVPFCLRGGFCRVGGIGEVLTPLGHAPEYLLLVIQPCGGLSTGTVFGAYHAASGISHPDMKDLIPRIQSGKPGSLPVHPGNVLEQASLPMAPEIGDAVDFLISCGAVCAQMSGSGSAVFGVFDGPDARQRAHEAALQRWQGVWMCETCEKPVHFVSESGIPD